MVQAARYRLFLFFLCTTGFSGFSQEPQDSTRFVLTLSFYNHAELVYNGAMIYRFTNDYLGISRRNLFDKEEKHLYSANIGKAVSDPVRLLRLDTLQMIYNNYCIISTSGNEYFISIESGTQEKRIHLHSYYHPQIERLIHMMNALVPEEYRMLYMSKDTKQDCK
jgi:hypothetical protein